MVSIFVCVLYTNSISVHVLLKINVFFCALHHVKSSCTFLFKHVKGCI
uniref:Uncharacterized protein n=1 Tax=Anguilla anguilla TaxID=7936 RepID=A0A0E9Q6N9_ANGAN